jgi:hypothetical protein
MKHIADYFEIVEEISKNRFLETWKKEEELSKHPHDSNTWVRLKKHEEYTELKYYIGKLTENGFNHLILPYHTHANNEVNWGGEPFWDVISKYLPRIREKQSDVCLKELYRIRDELLVWFNRSGTRSEAGFNLGRIYDDFNLAMPGHYRNHGENRLYVGNYHRFVAYGLWITEFGYQPLESIYCTIAPI